jgi:two-component system, OmpR family, response regulator CpxR
MKILIADDDQIQNLMLSTSLRARGFKVTIAQDAIQAWMAAVRTSPDAIILDIQMPGGTGYAVLKQLKSSSKTSQIPVIVLSGSIDPNAVETVKQLGADQFLRKPADMPSLLSALSQLLGIASEGPVKVPDEPRALGQ